MEKRRKINSAILTGDCASYGFVPFVLVSNTTLVTTAHSSSRILDPLIKSLGSDHVSAECLPYSGS